MEVLKDLTFARFFNWLKARESHYIEKKLELISEQKSHNWGEVFIEPKPSESLLSWLLRLSNQFSNEYTLKDFLEYESEYWKLHENIEIFENRSSSIFRSLELFDILSLRIFNMSLRKRGLQKDLSSLQLQFPRWFSGNIDKYSKDKLLIRKELVYCPVCWMDTEKRYFKIEWRFSLTVVCSDHGVLLRNSCSSCGKYLFSQSKRRVLTNISYTWLETCVHCGHRYNDKSINNRNLLNADPELLDLQCKVIDNVMDSEYPNLIQDLRLLFGIKWKSNAILLKFLDSVTKWVDRGRKIRPINGNFIIFDIWKFELVQKYNLGNLMIELRPDKILDLDTFEIKCFIDTCDKKYLLKEPNGKTNLILQMRTHIGLKRIERDTYKCERCEINFPNQYNYQLHYYEEHAKTVNCNKCDERFPTLSKYQIHLFNEHKEVWNCGKCGLSFPSNSEYSSHYAKEHQKVWNCVICNLSFEYQLEYRSHYGKTHYVPSNI